MPDRIARRLMLAVAATLVVGVARAGESYGIGRDGDAARDRRLGHRRVAQRGRTAARARRCETRRGDLRRQMRGLPRRPRRGQADGPAGRRHRHAARQEAGKDRRQLLALCDDAVRLRAPRHAVERAAVAHTRRSLCGFGLCAVPQRDRTAGHDARRRQSGRRSRCPTATASSAPIRRPRPRPNLSRRQPPPTGAPIAGLCR